MLDTPMLQPVDRLEIMVLVDNKTDSLVIVPDGIINVLDCARATFPGAPLHAGMGGFHLSGGNEKIIGETVEDVARFDLDLILPGQCTGWRAVGALERVFGDKVVPMAVGMSFDL